MGQEENSLDEAVGNIDQLITAGFRSIINESPTHSSTQSPIVSFYIVMHCHPPQQAISPLNPSPIGTCDSGSLVRTLANHYTQIDVEWGKLFN